MNTVLKRVIDISLAAIGLTVLSPLLALIAILVWLDSPGAVIFSQDRIGRNGKTFRIHKFRKFPPKWKNEGPCVTTRCDPRMTTIGALLERTKLDELPQLWNILTGDMSFVGPRPESLHFRDLYTGRYAGLLTFTPGIFGPNQIIYRNESERYVENVNPEEYYRRALFPQKAENDLQYFSQANCFKDIIIIFAGSIITVVGILNWKRFFKKDFFIIVMDGLLISTAWVLAYILRFSAFPTGENLIVMLTGLKIIPPLMIAGMLVGGCYRCPLKYFTLSSATRLSVVLLISWLTTFFVLIKLYRSISLYLMPMAGSLSIILLLVPRVFSRWHWEKTLINNSNSTVEILIYGAGKTGLTLASCLPFGKFVGFVDDDPEYRGSHIRGLKVFGHESDIPTIHKAHPFNEIWVTFEPSSKKRQRLSKTCKENDIKLVFLSDIEPFAAMKTSEKLNHAQNLTCHL